MFNQDVQIAFSLAVREAQRRRHEYLTTEHVLYAILFEETGQEVVVACGGDPERLRKGVEAFLEQHIEALDATEANGETALVDAVHTGMLVGESDVGRALVLVFSVPAMAAAFRVASPQPGVLLAAVGVALAAGGWFGAARRFLPDARPTSDRRL